MAQATKNISEKIIETLSLLAGNSTRAWASDFHPLNSIAAYPSPGQNVGLGEG